MKILKWIKLIKLMVIVEVKFYEFFWILYYEIRFVVLNKLNEFFIKVGNVYCDLLFIGDICL